jgi:hypothetical protein
MKRIIQSYILLVGAISIIHCGGDDSSATGTTGTGGSSTGAAGATTGSAGSGGSSTTTTTGSAGSGGTSTGSAGSAGSATGGSAGTGGAAGAAGAPGDAGSVDSGNCPNSKPAEDSACTTAALCMYGNDNCICRINPGSDAGRGWNCTATGMMDAAACPATKPADGSACTQPMFCAYDGGGCGCAGDRWVCR